MTYQVCHEKNINCYRLPIETYMEHSVNGGTFNQILAINQGNACVVLISHISVDLFVVFDILLSYISEKDWRQALKKNIPERKGWVIKSTTGKERDCFSMNYLNIIYVDSTDNKSETV